MKYESAVIIHTVYLKGRRLSSFNDRCR